MEIEPIAFFRSPLTGKFGIPRQSGIIHELYGCIEFVPKYRNADALRGMEGFDYLWLIWGFSENVDAQKHPTVRPPLLGGNERVGVWATRSPFRPNNLGLSSVRISKVDTDQVVVHVEGADLMDGTPIYDIKPYLPYVDSHADARGGFTDERPWQRLTVDMPPALCELLGAKAADVLQQMLALDPRPHYQHNADRPYTLNFMDYDITFRVEDRILTVYSWEKR